MVQPHHVALVYIAKVINELSQSCCQHRPLCRWRVRAEAVLPGLGQLVLGNAVSNEALIDATGCPRADDRFRIAIPIRQIETGHVDVEGKLTANSNAIQMQQHLTVCRTHLFLQCDFCEFECNA